MVIGTRNVAVCAVVCLHAGTAVAQGRTGPFPGDRIAVRAVLCPAVEQLWFRAVGTVLCRRNDHDWRRRDVAD